MLLLLRLCHYVIRFQFYTASSCMDLRASPKIMFFKCCTRTKPGRKPLHILTRNLAKGIWRPSENCAMQLTSQAFWTRPTRVLHVMEAGLCFQESWEGSKFLVLLTGWGTSCSTELLRCTQQREQAKHSGLQLWLVDSLWFFKTMGWVRASHGVVAS